MCGRCQPSNLIRVVQGVIMMKHRAWFPILLASVFCSLAGKTSAHHQALFSGLLPSHKCVQGNTSAELKCPVMDDRMVFKRLTPHMDAGGFVRDFTTSPLPAKRVFSHDKTTFLIKAAKDDQGLYGAVLNNTLSTMTCVIYLSVVTVKGGCTGKDEHLELIVKNNSKSVQRDGSLTLKSTVYRNGLPYPDRLVHFAYWDITNQSTGVQLTDKEGRVSGGTTSQLHLRNIPCTLTDVLVLASTNSASAKEYVHINFKGQLTIERNLPAKVHKRVGERLSLTAQFRSPSCQQPRITWKRSGDKLVTFSAEKPSGNSTVVNRRGLVSYDFRPDNGVTTTSLILYGVNLVDSEVYSAEAQVGEESMTAKTNFIVSDPTTGAILPSTLTVGDRLLIQLTRPSVTSRPQVPTAFESGSSPTNTSNGSGVYMYIAIGVLGILLCAAFIIISKSNPVHCKILQRKRKEQSERGVVALTRKTASPTGHYQQPPVTTDETADGLSRSSLATEFKAANNTPADSCATSLTLVSNSSTEADVDKCSQRTHTMADGTACCMVTLSTTGSSSTETANSKPSSNEDICNRDYAVSDKSQTVNPDRNVSTYPTSSKDVHKVLTCSSALLPGTASNSVHTEHDQLPCQCYTLTKEFGQIKDGQFTSTSQLDCCCSDTTQTIVGGEACLLSTGHLSANRSLTKVTDSERVDKLSGNVQLCAAIGQNEVLERPSEIAARKVYWNGFCNALSDVVTKYHMCDTLATQLGLVSDNPRNKLVEGLFIKCENSPIAVANELFRMWLNRTNSLSDDERLHNLHEIFFEIVPTTLNHLDSAMDDLLPKFLNPKL